MANRALVDLDDLWCERQLEELLPLKEAVPDLQLTLYTIPGMLGPVTELKARWPWVTFGIHGVYHTHAEALHLVKEDWDWFLGKTLEMGYDPVFKAPNWVADMELEEALAGRGIVLHCHKQYKPIQPGLQVYRPEHPKLTAHTNIHSHLTRNPSTDYWKTCEEFKPENLGRYSDFLTPLTVNYVLEV